jgi:hypothetical protein
MAKRLPRDPAQRRAAEIRAVIDLLDDSERQSAAERLGLAIDATADRLAELLAGSSRTETLRVLLAAAPEVVDMLKDIAGCLEQHGVSARTTGFILALEGSVSRTSIDLSAQEIDLVCSWPTRLEEFEAEPFAQLRRDWRSISALWSELVYNAYPRRCRRPPDLVRSYIRGQSIRQPSYDATDRGARLVLSHLLDRLMRTIEVLERIAADARTADLKMLLKALQHHRREALTALRAGRPVRATESRELPRRLKAHRRLDRRLTRFEEDVRALAMLNEDAAQDLLRYDLWRNRPQLFEVWILTSILDWLARRGYDVELLEVTTMPGGRQCWHLSYANATHPCARISGEGHTFYVFYQLRRKGEKGGADDMPDISLLTDPLPEHNAIWVIDPKHSARKAYRLADYRATGIRYVKSFDAKLAIIAEHYPRADLPEGNPYRLGDRALLAKDVRPRGEGLPMVLAELETFHPVLQRTVLCIDMSSSFDNRRIAALDAFRSTIAADGTTLADAFVWFAGSACEAEGAAVFVARAAMPKPPPLDPGTSLEALIDALRPLVDARIDRVAIVGDGKFGDAAWRDALEGSLGVAVVQYE